jgi:hypothetical protein
MRRLILLILMLVVPLQYAWSAVVAMDTHHAPVTLPAHADDHPHGVCHDGAVSAEAGNPHDDGPHGSHCHHCFHVLALLGNVPLLAHAESGGKLGEWRLTFYSRTPPLLDRPPAMRA